MLMIYDTATKAERIRFEMTFKGLQDFTLAHFCIISSILLVKKNKNNAITQSLESVSTVVWGEKSEKSF